METTEFDGVFRFTNTTDEDFTFLWNNKEYIFPSGKTTPMIIANEPLENIQEIRKRAAKKLAIREFYKGTIYNSMKEKGNGLPPTFDEKVLEPMIKSCLEPLPLGHATVKELPKEDETSYKASQVVDGKFDPKANVEVQPLGIVFPSA